MDQLVVTAFTTILILVKNCADTIPHFTPFWLKFFHVEICQLIDAIETKITLDLFG